MQTAVLEDEERVIAMLKERGIAGARDLVVNGPQLDSILGTIKWWDDLPQTRRGTGLLVSRIRDGGMAGYRRAHERTGPEGELVVGDRELDYIWRTCLSPDGLEREEARTVFSRLAERANTSIDSLLDDAVGERWQATPVHPAKRVPPHGEPPQVASLRYQVYVSQADNELARPDIGAHPEEGESEWAYACRFWRWTDPPALRKLSERLREEAVMAAAHEAAFRVEAGRSRERAAEEVRRAEAAKAKLEEIASDADAKREDLDERYGETMPEEDDDVDDGDLW